jgi:hypothetical protein
VCVRLLVFSIDFGGLISSVDSKVSEGIDDVAEDWNCVASGEDSRPQHHTITDRS